LGCSREGEVTTMSPSSATQHDTVFGEDNA
jgi:hypothetical protein